MSNFVNIGHVVKRHTDTQRWHSYATRQFFSLQDIKKNFLKLPLQTATWQMICDGRRLVTSLTSLTDTLESLVSNLIRGPFPWSLLFSVPVSKLDLQDQVTASPSSPYFSAIQNHAACQTRQQLKETRKKSQTTRTRTWLQKPLQSRIFEVPLTSDMSDSPWDVEVVSRPLRLTPRSHT